MTILNSEHLFEQAAKLVAGPAFGPLRQVDLRRAISSAYYGLFHFILTAVADEFVGVSRRTTSRYALVYRRIDHRGLRELCTEVAKSHPSPRYAPYPPIGFGSQIGAFAVTAVELQERRHKADYNSLNRFTGHDAQLAIATAREAVRLFASASAARRKVFLTLLLCPPR